MGRGVARRHGQARVLASEEPSENISLHFGDGEKYTVTGTPPLKPKRSTGARFSSVQTVDQAKSTAAVRAPSLKENQDPAVKATSFGSSTSSREEGEEKAPANLRASIESDESAVILDGETFRATRGRPITLRSTAPMPFLRLAA